MGCQSEVYLGDNLTFSVTTHDPNTGILTDPDAPPPYRIYEDETAVPILTGTMAILDNVNTTGFCTELVACTVANGFESGRSYTVYIEAAVGGDTGGIAYGFRTLEDVAGTVLSVIMAVSPIMGALRTEDLRLYRGDTWVQPITGLGNLTGYTAMWITAREDRTDTDPQSAFQVLLSAPPVGTDGLQYINAAPAATPGNAAITVTNLVAGAVSVRIEAVETAKLGSTAKLRWDFQWTDGTDVETRRRGDLFVVSDVTRATS